MGTMASQFASLIIVYSSVYSDADQRKHKSSASLAFVRGIHRGPVNSPHKWPVPRKMLPFDDVIKVYFQSCFLCRQVWFFLIHFVGCPIRWHLATPLFVVPVFLAYTANVLFSFIRSLSCGALNGGKNGTQLSWQQAEIGIVVIDIAEFRLVDLLWWTMIRKRIPSIYTHIMTSWHGNAFRIIGLSLGESIYRRGVIRLNRLLNKQSTCRSFETLCHSCHNNALSARVNCGYGVA